MVHGETGPVDAQAVDVDGIDGGVGVLVAAFHGGQAAEERTGLDRLGNEIVGPGFEGGYFGEFLGAGGEEQDVGVLELGLLAQEAASGDAVEVGHHHIKQDDVGVEIGRDIQGFAAIGGGSRLVAILLQVKLQQFNNVRVVVHYENLIHGRFGSSHGAE